MAEYSLGALAQAIGGEVHGDATLTIRGPAEIGKAGPNEITFLANPKYKDALKQTRAGAVIIDDGAGVTPAIPYIRVANAYYGFLQVFVRFHPPEKLLKTGVHPAAVVDETADLGSDVAIGAHAYIGPHVRVGDRSQIFPNSVILNRSRIGADCIIYPGVGIREKCRIGDRVIIHNGAVIGSDGFGFAPYEGRFHKIPQVGIVVIEDDVEIGANTTIDRAMMGETIIRSGVKLDNLVHLAHNVVVGEHTVMAAQSGISGSTRIGRRVMIGGQVGTVGHIDIGDDARIAAKTGVSKSVAPGETIMGAVGRPIMKNKRIEATISNLPELLKRVRALEKQVAKLEESAGDDQ